MTKISELIKNLIEFKDSFGDLECWYASDDEGNDYHPLTYTPTLCYLDEEGEITDADEIEDDSNIVQICLIN